MTPQIFPAQWLILPHETRVTLATELHLTRSGHPETITDASGTRVLSDGYTTSDLMGITAEKLQAYTGASSDNFYSLFEQAIIKAGNSIDVDDVLSASLPFCSSCTSKGVRHLKTCTRVIA